MPQPSVVRHPVVLTVRGGITAATYADITVTWCAGRTYCAINNPYTYAKSIESLVGELHLWGMTEAEVRAGLVELEALGLVALRAIPTAQPGDEVDGVVLKYPKRSPTHPLGGRPKENK